MGHESRAPSTFASVRAATRSEAVVQETVLTFRQNGSEGTSSIVKTTLHCQVVEKTRQESVGWLSGIRTATAGLYLRQCQDDSRVADIVQCGLSLTND